MLSGGLLDKNARSVPSCSSHQAIRKADLSVKTLSTLICRGTLLLAAFGSAGCSARTAGSAELQSLTPASAAAIDESARTFMHTARTINRIDLTWGDDLRVDLSLLNSRSSQRRGARSR